MLVVSPNEPSSTRILLTRCVVLSPTIKGSNNLCKEVSIMYDAIWRVGVGGQPKGYKSELKKTFTNWKIHSDCYVTEFRHVFVYLKCQSVDYWYLLVICQSQLTIIIHTRSTTIRDYSSINYLLQSLVFLVKIRILNIISRSENSKLNSFEIIFS